MAPTRSVNIPTTGTWEAKAGPVVTGFAAALKLKDFQAAAFPGNFGFESGEFKKLHEGGQPEGQGGYGWGQWTGPRRTRFLDWCHKNNLDWQSPEANYGFAIYEIKTFYKSLLTKLRKAVSIEDATFLVYSEYETPQEFLDGHYDSLPFRVSYAKRALRGTSPVVDPPVATSPNLDYALMSLSWLVRIIQHELGLKIDGDYGADTRAAVQDYLKKGTK